MTSHLRSFCDTIYSSIAIAKILTERVKAVLPHLVSTIQYRLLCTTGESHIIFYWPMS